MVKKIKFNTTAVALVGIMTATIECGKLVLSFLPNIEVVTLLCALYGYVFGWLGVAAAFVFVCIEPLIYGIGGWVITYALYWPAVAIIFAFLGRKKIKKRVALAAVAVGLTVLFGVLSSFVDAAFYLGINKYFLKNFCLYYVRGIGFYIVQILCNATVFMTLFSLLSDKLLRIKSTLKV